MISLVHLEQFEEACSNKWKVKRDNVIDQKGWLSSYDIICISRFAITCSHACFLCCRNPWSSIFDRHIAWGISKQVSRKKCM